jgi:hypothetical protein
MRFRESLDINARDRNLVGMISSACAVAVLDALEGDIDGARATYAANLARVDGAGIAEAYVPGFGRLRDKLLELGVPPEDLPLPENWR